MLGYGGMTSLHPPNFAHQTIWTADNLEIMRGMNSDCVDLIYLDPPFNSNANYAAPIGSEAAGAEFKDTWSLNDVDVEWINLIAEKHSALNRVLRATMTNSSKSYLAYMAARILEMHRILKPTGLIYLHCDPTMSHYLKLVMDAIFGVGNFRNEIIWGYSKWTNAASYFQRNHDIIFCYGKSDNVHFNPQHNISKDKQHKLDIGYQVNRPQGTKQLIVYDRKKAKTKIEEGNYDKVIYMDEREHGTLMSDVWTDINILNSQSKERTGYPTQKPLALLQRIIKASSNEGDMVLDPFCGCATACIAAELECREWAGIDISPKAAELVQRRMTDEVRLFYNGVHRDDIPQRTDIGKIPPPNTHKNSLYGGQAGHCAGCGEHFKVQHLEVDHIIARSKGGTDHKNNLQLLCGSCNKIKGDRGMEYLKTKLNFV